MGLEGDRARARELGVEPGVLPPGPLNAITDVSGVRVGHVMVWEDDHNSLLMATSFTGYRGHTAEQLPLSRVLALLRPGTETGI